MRYFYKLTEGMAVAPFMLAVARQGELWDRDPCRTTFDGTPHGEVNDIILRFGSVDFDEAGDDLEAVDRPEMQRFPGLKTMLLDLMRLVGGVRLGRVVITKLEPGKRILPHADVVGKYAEYYTRFHVVLQGLPGSTFTCGEGADAETVQMLTGECWWFDAHAMHALSNNSKDDRIHLLVDIRIDK